MANAARDLAEKGLAIAVISPGWVQTDMGGKQAPLKVTDSAAGIIKVIYGLTPETTGSFFNYNGDALPW
jgi:NAD(P)-dependent dehydrogenase (short-subunit alcohol dehydrogenase family)